MAINFQIAISQEWEGQLTWNERDAMLDPLCNLGLAIWVPTGNSTYQIHWPSNWFMQNSYSLQPVGPLTHWSRVMHVYVSKLTTIGSDNGLAAGWRQTIIWTNAGILLIGPWGTDFSEICCEIHAFSFKKIHLKISSGKWQPFCLGLNKLMVCPFSDLRAEGCCHSLNTWLLLMSRERIISLWFQLRKPCPK